MDYNSNDGMMTYVWGPPQWFYLHTMSFNYPVRPTAEQKRHYRAYVESLQHTLPCGACRTNLARTLRKEHRLTASALKNRDSFSRWVYELHEHVNRMLGKPSSLTYEEVRERFEHFRARCTGTAAASKENGCTASVAGRPSKCVLQVVPRSSKRKTQI